MKKIVILTILLMFIMSLSAFATWNRTRTMGHTNIVLVDDMNIWAFPGRTFNYPNIAVAELGGSSLYEFGIHWKFGEEKPFVLATYFSTLSETLPGGFGDNGDAFGSWDALDDDTHHRNIDLLYGRELGNNLFGFYFGYYSVSYEDTDTLGMGKEAAHYFDVGVGLTDGGGDWDIAAFFQMGGWTDEDNDGKKETEADGYTDFAVIGRYFWHQSPTYTLIPHVGAGMGSHGEKDNVEDMIPPADPESNDINTKSTYTGFHGGLGLNFVPASNVLAVADFGFSYYKAKQEYDWTTTYAAEAGTAEVSETETILPYWKIGFEADVFKWMDVRMGAVSDWMSTTELMTTTFEEKHGYADTDTYLGFGFHWGRLHVDTWTDPDLFLKGFDFISGAGAAFDDMNFSISALYEMF